MLKAELGGRGMNDCPLIRHWKVMVELTKEDEPEASSKIESHSGTEAGARNEARGRGEISQNEPEKPSGQLQEIPESEAIQTP
jgi:hypothetical protein